VQNLLLANEGEGSIALDTSIEEAADMIVAVVDGGDLQEVPLN
jgi:hypothetical protein